MAKYNVYGTVGASVFLGTYEAKNEDDAIEQAEDNENANWSPTLCHQCSRELEVGDVYETQAELVEDET